MYLCALCFNNLCFFYLQTFRQRHVRVLQQDGCVQVSVGPGDCGAAGSAFSCPVGHDVL